MESPITEVGLFKNRETEEIVLFMRRNTNEDSIINRVFSGNYRRQILTNREVFEICCFLASAFFSDLKQYKYIINCLHQYDQNNSRQFNESVYLCSKALLNAIDFERLNHRIKSSIFDLCADLIDFIARKDSLTAIHRSMLPLSRLIQ